EMRGEVGPEPGRVVPQVALEILLGRGFVHGSHRRGGGPVEADPAEAAGGEDLGDVLVPHVLDEPVHQRRLHLDRDLVPYRAQNPGSAWWIGSSSTIACSRAPAGVSNWPSGRTSRAFASTIEVSMPEPCGPVRRASGPVGVSCTIPRRKCCSLGFTLIGSAPAGGGGPAEGREGAHMPR